MNVSLESCHRPKREVRVTSLMRRLITCLAVGTEYIVLAGGLHTVSACSVVGH